MKLRNKKTGKIINSDELLTDKFILDLFSRDFDYFNSKLHKIEDEWEEYEEPKDKDFWFFDEEGIIRDTKEENWPEESVAAAKEIGNYFETKEEAELAVRKLKAWKRLKDEGFRFNGGDDACISYRLDPVKWDDCLYNDFNLLFGGEE